MFITSGDCQQNAQRRFREDSVKMQAFIRSMGLGFLVDLRFYHRFKPNVNKNRRKDTIYMDDKAFCEKGGGSTIRIL